VQNEAAYHFTYRPSDGDLGQGDLLEKTDEVDALLRDVHPHYAKSDYVYFLVLTQSCDLVRRREGVCAAQYITLAAVRPLSLLLERAVSRFQDEFARRAGVCGKGEQSGNKRRLEEFVERLLNNNEPEYFYLEPEVGVGLASAACAFLRLSVAVRAGEHYEKLLRARRLSLADVFQAKLGWLVGQMYSRVGTPDWVPDRIPNQSQFQKKIDRVLGAVVQWVDDDQLKAAKASAVGLETRMELQKHIQQTGVQKHKDRVLDAVMDVVRGEELLDEAVATRLRRVLGNDPSLATLLR